MSPSSASLCPARLAPIFAPRLWGARTLAPFFPEKSNLAEPFGEAWLTGGNAASRPARSPARNWATFGRLCRPSGPERNQRLPTASFPLLVKFIFAEDKLSVQVHPDDEYAARHEQAAGGRGKTEMWYAVRARPDAEVLAGLKPGVTPEIFQARHQRWFC